MIIRLISAKLALLVVLLSSSLVCGWRIQEMTPITTRFTGLRFW
jgi:hypothetical protein